MGLFGKSAQEIAFMERSVPGLSKQVDDSITLVDSTVKPDVFFSRYDFLLQTLGKLADMEPYIKFKKWKPSKLLKKLRSPSTRDEATKSFIERAYKKLLDDIAKLKTDKAKVNKAEKFFTEMGEYKKHLSKSNLALLETLRQTHKWDII